jgi:hypothetical protein
MKSSNPAQKERAMPHTTVRKVFHDAANKRLGVPESFDRSTKSIFKLLVAKACLNP